MNKDLKIYYKKVIKCKECLSFFGTDKEKNNMLCNTCVQKQRGFKGMIKRMEERNAHKKR